MIFKKSIIIFISVIIFCFGCKGTGGGFSGFEDSATEGKTPIVVAPIIESWSPITSTINLLSNTEKTFSVTVSAGAGTVIYKYVLDGIEKQSSTSPLYIIDTSTVSVGAHSLVVTATNSVGSDSLTFNLLKNSPPMVTLNSQTSTTINCSGGTFNLSVNTSDADTDSLTYSFLLNGSVNGTFLVGTNGATSASTVFTPNCGFSGSNNVAIKVTDSKGDSTTYTVSVLVTNPFAASINSFSPVTDPTVILSTAISNFSITASGNAPFQYGWVMTPGSTIASCAGLATCPIIGTDFTPGRYTLTATLTDSLPSTATKAFTVVLNQKPQVTATPSNASTINMNCSNIKNFNLTINDANYGDSSQTFSVSWKLNGSTHASLTNTTVLGSNPMTSQAVFSPNCNSSLLGAQSVSVVISDGHESVTYIWPLNVNYFSETCNNLTSSQICTAVGRLGMSSEVNLLTQAARVNIQPWQIEKHSTNSYFIADNSRHGIWFYNTSGAAITVFGKTIANNTLKLIVGHGAFGSSIAGNVDDLYLYNPRGMAYNPITGDLYIANTSNSNIVKIDSSGNTSIFAGGGANNVDGNSRTDHKCSSPIDLVLDASDNKLFVTCSGNTAAADGAVKYFMTNANMGYTIVRYSATTNADGSTGYSGVGKSRVAYGLTKHPNKKILFMSDLSVGNILAVSYGGTEVFYNGAVSLAADSIVNLTSGAQLGSIMNKTYGDTSLRIRPYDLVLKLNGSNVEGIFFNNYNDSVIGLLNVSAGDITFGGQTIASGFINNISIQAGGYSRGATPSHANTYVKNPYGMILDGNYLIIADVNNGFISKMDVSGTNTPFTDIVGYEAVGVYDGETSQNLNNRRLNRPSALLYRSTDNTLYISDEDNYRVRKLNLTSGALDTVMGSGVYGNANINPTTTPFTAPSQNITGLHLFNSDSVLLYTDFNGADGVSRNCHVRGYNFTGTDQTHFGQLLENNRVRSVAGNYTTGCAAWVPASHESQSAIAIPLRAPNGIITNASESELYISDRSSHCIFKMNGGTITSYIGTCNTTGSGGTNSISTSHLLTNPGFMKKDRHSSNTSGENFFIVQRSRNTASEIKFVNKGSSTITINYIDVGPNEIRTVISSLNYVSGIATYEDQICYSQGAGSSGSTNAHNVECINRTTGTSSIRIGRPSASTVKAKVASYDEQEGINASSSTLSNPFDIEFDSEGNLWISDTYADALRKVKKWF